MNDDMTWRQILGGLLIVILVLALFVSAVTYGTVWNTKVKEAAKTERARIYAESAEEIVEQICPWWQTKEAK